MSEWPTCACGCKRPVATHKQSGRPRKYATDICRDRISCRIRPVEKIPRSVGWPRCECGCGELSATNEWTKKPRQYASTTCRYRTYRRKLRQDPERHERYLQKQRVYCKRYHDKAKANPEILERVREYHRRDNRKRYQKVRSDPKKWVRQLEDQRMRYAIRQQKRGAKRRPGFADRYLNAEQTERLPAPPVAAWIDGLVERSGIPRNAGAVDVVCSKLGIDPRNYLGWRNGERATLQFDVLDRLLTNADVLWWEVYDEDRWPGEYEKAKAVFEPDEDLEAA